MVLQAAQRPAEAVIQFEQALALNPNYAIALNNLGNALHALGRRTEAVARYRRVLEIDPHYAAACNNLGTTLLQENHPEEAIAQFRRALELRPAFAEARMNLGNALAGLEKHREAVAHFRQALIALSGSPELHLALGRALQALDEHREAIQHYRAAVSARPDLAEGHASLGTALQEIGEMEEAGRCFDTAASLEPARPIHFLNLTANRMMRPGDESLTALLEAAKNITSLTTEEQSILHFALAKALADIGEHACGFDHLLQANALHRSLIRYDEADRIGLMDRIRAVFTAGVIEARQTVGPLSEAPVFIIGMPRSGSTLIEQILAAHPNVFAAGELMAFRDALRELGPMTFPEDVPALADQQISELARTVPRIDW